MKRFALFSTAIGLILLVSACSRFDCGFGDEWGPMMNVGNGGMFMGIIPLIILVVLAIWWFTRGVGSKDDGRLPGETPLEILKKRYARGEITKEEFEKIKKDLEV
jgi:putative membrane protein